MLPYTVFFCARDQSLTVIKSLYQFFRAVATRGFLLSSFFSAFYSARGRLDSGILWIWREGEGYTRRTRYRQWLSSRRCIQSNRNCIVPITLFYSDNDLHDEGDSKVMKIDSVFSMFNIRTHMM